MAQPEQLPNADLPESLTRQFAALERRLWKVETATQVSLAVLGAALAFLALFVSDRLWDTPVWLRAVLLLAALTTAAWAAFRWASVWIWKRRGLPELAIIVQRRFRRLGDRLLGIVELSREKEHPAHYSVELYRAAIRQVAGEAGQYRFQDAVDTFPARRLLWMAAAVVLLALLPALVVPRAASNALTRLAAPAAGIPRYTLVRLAEVPSDLIVPHGETFEIIAAVQYESFWRPRKAVVRFPGQLAMESKVENGRVRFRIPAQVQKQPLELRVGDGRAVVAVDPQHRPALKQLTALVQMPDYLHYPQSEQRVQSASLPLLEGSTVSFAGNTTRGLRSGSLLEGSVEHPLEISGERFTTPALTHSAARQLAFVWQDVLGLTNANPWKLSLSLVRDQAPVVDLPDLGRDVAILHTDVLNLKASARDDFGVRDIGLSWDFAQGSEEIPDWATTAVKNQVTAPREKAVERTFRWSPAVFRIPPDTVVEMVAFAADYHPERERSESSVRRIHVLGNEQHAELVRQNLESVLARIEEVARLQEKIFAGTSEAVEAVEAAKDSEDPQAARAAAEKAGPEKLGKLGDEQSQNAAGLEQLAREGMQALREALKNPVFSEPTIQEWAKTLRAMEELAQQPMQQSAGDLKSAQKNAADAARKQQELAKAQQKQQEILEALEQLQGKVNRDLDDLQALTLSERLRKVGEVQGELGAELKKIIPETVGLLPAELPERFRRAETKLAKVQDQAHGEARTLQSEIHRFFERTQKPNYGEVSEEMQELRTPDELERVREMIENNIAMEATRNLGEWSKRFGDWAKKLEPPSASNPPGSGQGEGQESLNMTQTLIALLRLRESELNLHRQTTVLEEQRPSLQNYGDRAQSLLETQQKISGIFKEIQAENRVPELEHPYHEAGEAMQQIESFLKVPQTDAPTTQAQLKTVELLTDLINLINEQAQRNPPPSSGQGNEQNSAEEMAFLMERMMSPAQGEGESEGQPMNQPGGNRRGGTTDRLPGAARGDARGRGGEDRRVDKASGAAGMHVPTEFRSTLEKYFKALEQESQ